MQYRNPEIAVQYAEKNICPSCGEDRTALRIALSEREWVNWPNPLAGGFFGKSEAGVKAEMLINKCSECQEYFYGGKNNG